MLLLVSAAAHPERRLGAGGLQGLGSAWQDAGGPRAPNRQARGCGDRSGQAAMRGLPAGRLSGGGCSPQTLRLSAPEWAPLPLSTGPGLRLPEARLSAGLDGRVSIPEVGAALPSSGSPAPWVTRQVTVWPPIGRTGEASTRSLGEVWVVLPWGFDACHLHPQVKTVLIGEVWACQGALSGSDGGGTVVWRPCWGPGAGGQSSLLSRGWSVCLPDLRIGGPHLAPGGFKAEVTFQTLL